MTRGSRATHPSWLTSRVMVGVLACPVTIGMDQGTFTHSRYPHEIRSNQKAEERSFGMSLPVRLDSVFAVLDQLGRNGYDLPTSTKGKKRRRRKKGWEKTPECIP